MTRHALLSGTPPWGGRSAGERLVAADRLAVGPLSQASLRLRRAGLPDNVLVAMTTYEKPLPDYGFAVPYVPPAGKPLAFICDIDGTLMSMGDREFVEYDKVHLDIINADVARLVRVLRNDAGWRPLFVSGRPERCRQATEESIEAALRVYCIDQRLTWDLHMRPDFRPDGKHDYRPDYIVKYEIFDREIRDQYVVTCAIDDRLQVVHLWRAMGILTLDVAGGDF